MSFGQVVMLIDSAYKQDRLALYADDLGNPISQGQLHAPFIRRTMQLFATASSPEPPPITNPGVSSLGKNEKFMKWEHACGDEASNKTQVEDMWMMVEVNSPAVFCHQ